MRYQIWRLFCSASLATTTAALPSPSPTSEAPESADNNSLSSTPSSSNLTVEAVPVTIPDIETYCYSDEAPLDPTEVLAAKEALIDKVRNKKVEPLSVSVETVGEAAWYVCNCKYFWYDPLPEDELTAVEDLLAHACGKYIAGWVWSWGWSKGYNLVPASFVKNKVGRQLCPGGCTR
ncbi:hypothetical protein F5B20DRAFT_597188 [Whalleya microplaca]|nr:hypothetical protein F5B20DRAFT_597188 [Whalleya microplaca]